MYKSTTGLRLKERSPLWSLDHSGDRFIVPRAGIEPARTFVHWCLRPTRLPIPPSGLIGSAAKIRQLLEVADTDSLHYTMRSIPLLLHARSTIAFHS